MPENVKLEGGTVRCRYHDRKKNHSQDEMSKVKESRLDLEIGHIWKGWHQLGSDVVICLGRLKPVTLITQLLLNVIGRVEHCFSCNPKRIIS